MRFTVYASRSEQYSAEIEAKDETEAYRKANLLNLEDFDFDSTDDEIHIDSIVKGE